MKNGLINDLQIYGRKLLTYGTFILVGGASILTGCDNKVVAEPIAITKTIDKKQKENYVDDVIGLDKKFKENLGTLETYLNLVQKIEQLQLEEFEGMKLAEIEIKDLKEIESKTIDLIQNYKKDNLTEVEKARLTSELFSIQKHIQKWIDANGLQTTEQLLFKVIKSYACQISGLSPEEYSNCKIKVSDSILKNFDHRIEIYDSISGINLTYFVKSDTLKTAIDDIVSIQYYGTETTSETINHKCEDGINDCIKVMEAGVKLDNKNRLIDQFTPEEIEAQSKKLTR